MYVCVYVCMSALNLQNRLSQGYQTWRAQPLGGVDCHAPLEIFLRKQQDVKPCSVFEFPANQFWLNSNSFDISEKWKVFHSSNQANLYF